MDEPTTSDNGPARGCLQVLPVDGSELTYRVTGNGPPVLLAHGAFGVLEVWDEISDLLAVDHQVISYDRRGHGRSPNGTPDTRVHAQDAAALIEHVAGEPAIVVGWSGGAAVATEMVRSHPDWVSAAVLVEGGFHMPQAQPVNAVRLLLSLNRLWRSGRIRDAADTMGRFVFARRSGGNSWDELTDHQREWLLGDAEGLRAEVRLHKYGGPQGYISAKEVATWSTPITYLLGEDTAPIFEDCHRLFTKKAGQIRTIRVPGASHAIPLQQPAAVADAVRSAVPA
jgi:pimeloyl-ACP methyl ester carboxylesterase